MEGNGFRGLRICKKESKREEDLVLTRESWQKLFGGGGKYGGLGCFGLCRGHVS